MYITLIAIVLGNIMLLSNATFDFHGAAAVDIQI